MLSWEESTLHCEIFTLVIAWQQASKGKKKAANILYWQKNKESEFEEQNLLILWIIIFKDSFKVWVTATFQGSIFKNITP